MGKALLFPVYQGNSNDSGKPERLPSSVSKEQKRIDGWLSIKANR